MPFESRSGHKVEVEFVSNVYEEDKHQVVQCNVRDITERSRLQRLTEEQAAALADLDRRKDEFLAMLSHELRNPLAPILNAALLLRMDSSRNRLHGIENPVLQQSAAIIERQVGQLSRIVDELLEVSRITTGRIQLHQDRIALGMVVANAVATVRSLLDQRKHRLTVSLPSQPVWLQADAARLEQVVVNLLTNAAKYTDQGGQIWLTVQQESEQAVLRVRDTGVGIAPEILPPHLRAVHASGTVLGPLARRLGNRTGFGATPRGNARREGGGFQRFGARQRVRCTFAGGATSRIAAVIVARLKRSSGLDQPCGCWWWMTRRYGDDLGNASERIRHAVRMAYDGTSVVEAALDYRPNVVLLDIGLPGLNGYEVAKQLRQQPALQNTVLVAMTGYGQESDRQRSKDAGFDHHLVKPGDFGKVLQILATI